MLTPCPRADSPTRPIGTHASAPCSSPDWYKIRVPSLKGGSTSYTPDFGAVVSLKGLRDEEEIWQSPHMGSGPVISMSNGVKLEWCRGKGVI
jgi:hypothetical protein